MRATDVFENALASLRADARQTTLACLGIVCGVAAVVTALAIGEGAKREALADVDLLGVGNVIVDSPSMCLTSADVSEIGRTIAGAVRVAPVRAGQLRVETPGASIVAVATGVTTAWADTSKVVLARGRWLSTSDVTLKHRVAVLGGALARRLLPGRDPVGASIRLASDWYVVIGMLAAPSPQDAIFVPLGALDARLSPQDGPDRLSRIVVATRRPDDATVVAGQIERLIRRVQPADAVHVIVPRELVAARLRARRALDALLLAIGTLVLATSGLGIMTVMLAAIARRVTEIGVRRAVGARRRDVVGQFTGESILICALGGTAGVPLGAGAAAIVGRLAGWTTAISPMALILALGMAISTGLVFGIYPACVAARWTPCEALRNG